MESNWVCRICGKTLTTQKVVFEYLGHSVSQELPRCPQCGKVLITSELAVGKMAEVEVLLEDK